MIEAPNCPNCDNKLKKEREEKLSGSKIIYFYCTTVIKEETDTRESVLCNGRDHTRVQIPLVEA